MIDNPYSHTGQIKINIYMGMSIDGAKDRRPSGSDSLVGTQKKASGNNRILKEIAIRTELSEAVTNHIEPEVLLPNVLDILIEGFSADGGAIYFKDLETERIIVKATKGIDPSYMQRFRVIEMGSHVTGKVAQSGKPLLVHDSMSDDRSTKDVVRMIHYRSAMAVPVTSKDEVVGIIALISAEPGAFKNEDLSLLDSVGSHLSPAIVNSFLYQEIASERQKIRDILEGTEEGIFEALSKKPIPYDENVTKLVAHFLKDARFTLVNLSFEKQSGVSDLTGRQLKDGFHEGAIERFLRKAVRKGFMEDGESRTIDDITRMFEVSIIPIFHPDGSLKGIHGTRRDITRRKEMEEKLRRSKENTELYLDILLHDISNINTVSSGFLELMMLRPDLTDRSMSYLKYCSEAVKRASSLINKVRTLSYIDMDSQEKLRFDLVSLFDNVLDSVRTEYPDKNIVAEKTGVKGRAEINAGALLTDMMRHLISNAIIHNPNPKVELYFDLKEQRIRDIEGYIMSISDNGCGIPDILKENVFIRSKRQDGNLPGSGLGLSIVKGVVEKYGGEIWVEDRIKGNHSLGSSFKIFLRR